MPTDTEKATRCEAWARALMGNVPEGDLQRSFDHAFANHDSNFPVNAYDIIQAYRAMCYAEQERRRKEQVEFLRRQEEQHRLLDKFECCYCFNSGWRTITDPKGGDYKGVIRCDRCEHWGWVRHNLNNKDA